MVTEPYRVIASRGPFTDMLTSSANRTGLALSGGLAAFLCVAIISWVLTSGFERLNVDLSALNETAHVEFKLWIAVAIALGIVAKQLYDYFSGATEEDFFSVSRRTFIFNFIKSVVLASVVSPIVLFSIMQLLRDVNDPYLTCLVGFQNGFFFQSVLTLPKRSRK